MAQLRLCAVSPAVELCAVLGVCVAPVVFDSILLSISDGGAPQPSSYASIAIVSRIVTNTSVLLLIYAFLAFRGEAWGGIGVVWKGSAFLRSLGVAFVALVLSVLTAFFLSRVVEGTPYRLHGVDALGWWMAFLKSLLIMSSVAFEEVGCRAYVATRLIQTGFPRWVAAIITIVVQASYHVNQGWSAVIVYLPVFSVLAAEYCRSRNAWVIALAHLYLDFFWWAVR